MRYQSAAKREKVPLTRKKSQLRNPVSIKGETKKKRKRRKEMEKDGKAFRSPRRITVLLRPLLSSFSAKYLSSLACCPDFVLHLVSRNTRGRRDSIVGDCRSRDKFVAAKLGAFEQSESGIRRRSIPEGWNSNGIVGPSVLSRH